VSYDDYLIELLKNQSRAKAYLDAALEDDDPRVLLMALRNVTQARGISRSPRRTLRNGIRKSVL